MKKSIGLLEFKSVAKGMEVADDVLKAANIELVMCTPICPGKYVVIITGDVGAVNSAINVGIQKGGIFMVEGIVLPNIHPEVLPALMGLGSFEGIKDIGVIETMSALASIQAADIAVKAANITLIEVRIARGLGGKGFVIFTGEISSVKNAIKACENEMSESGELLCSSVLASPSKELIPFLM